MAEWERKIRDISNSKHDFVVDIHDFILGDVIGVGGYGKVRKAFNRETGEDCAIKQIYKEKLEGSKLRRYLNEINTMSVASNLFLLDFVGFTNQQPYSIVTKFMPNSSLEKYIYKDKCQKQLSGTQLTCIAIGISYGMMYLHNLGIIHRDLKPENVLLDEYLNPKICDFGISRFYELDDDMTAKIGTPSSMAPELMTSNQYNNKVDVYSMAILLYEMSEGKRAFKGFKINDIFSYVVNFDFRPKFTESTPMPLRLLIKRCWDSDPNVRPPFEEIFAELASGRVSFPDTNRPHVVAFLQMIEKDESKRKGEVHLKMRRYADVTKWIAASDTEKQEEEFVKENFIDKKISPNVIKILNNPKSPKFRKTVAKYAASIDINSFNDFFSPLYTLLYNKIETATIMRAAISMMDRDTTFICFFDFVCFFSLLPLNTKTEAYLACECLSFLFTERPCDINAKHFPLINGLIPKKPKKMLILHSFYARSFAALSDPYLVIDNLMANEAKLVENNVGYLLLSILFYLMDNFEDFARQRGRPVFKCIMRLMNSQHTQTIITAYDTVSQLLFKIRPEEVGFRLDYKLAVKHLNDGKLWKAVTSLLIRLNYIKINEELLKILLIRSHQSPRPWVVLFKIAGYADGARFLFEHDEWLSEAYRHPSDVTRLFLILFSQSQYHSRVLEMPNLATLLQCLFDSGDAKLYKIATGIIRYMQHDQHLMNFLTQSGVIKNFINVTLSMFQKEKESLVVNNKIKKNALLLFDTLARIGYLNEYLLFVDTLIEMMADPNFTKDAITVIVSFSQYAPLALAFKEKKLDRYFAKLAKFPNYADSVDVFLKNLKRIK